MTDNPMPQEVRELVERLRQGVTWSDGKRIEATVGEVNDPVMERAAQALAALKDNSHG